MQKNKSSNKIFFLILAAFLWSVSTAQLAYVSSSFLNQFFSLQIVSLIFLVSYMITFILMNIYPNIIARFNNLKTSISLFILEIIGLLLFIYIPNIFIVLIAFLIYIICINLIFINFDIFLEANTTDIKTGRIRGIYYTFYNLGWVVSPIIAGWVLANHGFNYLFTIAILIIIPIILILLITFQGFKNKYSRKNYKISQTIKSLTKHPNLEKIFYIAFLLQLFYAVMVIYIPIYLNQILGLPWDQIGIIFTIMLIPFVLLEFPAGYIADKYIGEKEILIAGITITSIICLIIFLTNSTNWVVWAIILFFSRVGASLIEIMRDTYFFKKVDVENLELINAFRSTMPLAYIFTPLLGAIVIYFLPVNYIFLFLAIILFTGLYFIITLKDTK